MIESIVLDVLLVLVVFLMMAIGAYRGGMREAYSAAGLLLGVLLAIEWLDTWGGWVASNTNLSDGGGRFLVAVTTMTFVTVAVGYGVGSSFGYHPGPGGRMFGVLLAAGSALIAISYVLTWLRRYVFAGEEPEVVGGTFLARFLDGDSGFILLLTSVTVVVAALLGSIVREREGNPAAESALGPAPAPHTRQHQATQSDFPDKVEPVGDNGSQRTKPIRVRESKQWQDRTGTMPSRKDRLWSNTWPSDSPGVNPESQVRPAGDVRRARERRQRDGDASSEGNNNER